MKTTSSKVVLVTGAGSGIGRAAVGLLAKRGFAVAAVARKDRDILDLRGVKGVFPYKADLSRPEQVEELAARIKDAHGGVDVLVNNAGFGLRGAVEETGDALVRGIFEVNVFAPLFLVRKFLPGMREKGDGLIINIGSVTGVFSSPVNGIYASTKHALEGWTDALRMEVASFGVRVVLIQLGPVDTNFFKNSREYSLSLLEKRGSPYTRAYERMMESISGLNESAVKPEDVARLINRIIGMKNPRARYRRHRLARVAPHLLYFFPRKVLDLVLQRKAGLR